MDQSPLTYVSSPQGWWRCCVGDLALALPLFVWLRVFDAVKATPTAEAMEFAGELAKSLGLACERLVV